MNKVVKSESLNANAMASLEEEEDDDDDLKARKRASGSKVVARCCQADKCGTDLAVAKAYHKRHKVCEVHAKAQVVLVAGIRQRFCQQCSRFHEVAEFDEAKRSCRRRLAGHNERRRKSPAAAAGAGSHSGQEMSSSRKAAMACGRVDDGGRFYSSLPVAEKHFHIR